MPVGLQIEAQQDRIWRFKAVVEEADLIFAFLYTTERLDVTILLCCRHNSRCTASKVILEQVDRVQGPVEQSIIESNDKKCN